MGRPAWMIIQERGNQIHGTKDWAVLNEELGDLIDWLNPDPAIVAHYLPPHGKMHHYDETGEVVIDVHRGHFMGAAGPGPNPGWEHEGGLGGSPARPPWLWDGWTRLHPEGAPRLWGFRPADCRIYKQETGRGMPEAPRRGGAYYGDPIPRPLWEPRLLPDGVGASVSESG